MIDLSTIQEEQIKLVDTDTVEKYFVSKERIDLRALREERQRIKNLLAMVEPTNKELIDVAKMWHPYYQRDEVALRARLAAIRAILGAD